MKKKLMKPCEFEQRDSTFYKEIGTKDYDNGKTCFGHWVEHEAICVKFEKPEEQLQRMNGFLLCGNKSKCSYYKPKKTKE